MTRAPSPPSAERMQPRRGGRLSPRQQPSPTTPPVGDCRRRARAGRHWAGGGSEGERTYHAAAPATTADRRPPRATAMRGSAGGGRTQRDEPPRQELRVVLKRTRTRYRPRRRHRRGRQRRRRHRRRDRRVELRQRDSPPDHETPHSRVGGNGYSRGHQPRRDGGVGRPSPSGATRPGHAPALARRRQPRAQAPAPPPHTSTFAPVTRQRRAARQPQEDPRLGLSRAIAPPAAGHGRRADALPRPQVVQQPLHPVCRDAPTRRENRAPQGATVGDRGGHRGRHRDGRLHAAHRRTGRRLGAAAARGRAGGSTIARKNVVGKCQVSRREHQVTCPVAGPFRPAPCQGRDQTSVDGGGGGDGCRRPDADRRGVSRPPSRPPPRTAAAAAQQPPAPAMPPTLATTAAVAAATHGCLPA